MLTTLPNKSAYHALLLLLAVAALSIIAIPSSAIDLIILIATLFIIGHIFLREKLLLAFLVVRPLIDIWRDVGVFTYRHTTINVNAIVAIIWLLWGSAMLWYHRDRLRTTPLALLFPALALFMMISAAWSIAPVTTVVETIKIIDIALFFFLSFIFVKEKVINIRLLFSATLLSACIPTVTGIIQWTTGAGMDTFGVRGRLFGSFAHPNVFAFYLLSLIFLLIHLTTIEKKITASWPRWVINTSFVLLTILLLMTFTRAAWIGLVFFLLIIGLLRYSRVLAYLVASIALLYIILFPFNQTLLERANISLERIPIIGRVTSRNEDADSLTWRLSLVRETMPLIQMRLWRGYGYGTFEKVWEENRGDTHLFDDSAESHNDYLRLALEVGFIGLALYMVLLGRMIFLTIHPLITSKGIRKEYIFVFAWLVTFIVVSISDNMLHHTPVMWLMWSWWGALIAQYKGYQLGPNFLS